jgi:glutathione synthase/RimK-type ligase-like ATP-grasp enzyme
MLLVSTAKTDNVRNFIQGVEAASEGRLKITYATYDDFCFVLGGGGASKITLLDSGTDIATFDIVHFKTAKERDVSAAIAHYLQKRGVPFLDQKVQHFAASSKIYQYIQLADNGIRIPKSVFVMPDRYETMFDKYKSELGLPFVLKGIHASRGDNNFLVRDEAAYRRIVRQLTADAVFVIGQKFIPNDGDYRILVLGRRIALVIYRNRKDDSTHLNNTSQGSMATLVPIEDLPTQVQTDSISAATLLERGVAGVDMLEDKITGSWYCLEVNDGPQLATGAFVPEKQVAFAKYIETELEKS